MPKTHVELCCLVIASSLKEFHVVKCTRMQLRAYESPSMERAWREHISQTKLMYALFSQIKMTQFGYSVYST